ncbi:serine threonine-protein kinase [Lentinula edodes]|uniref:Serine threonine-protein kinase n=1 Tax=Lentinula edodes TaxID=5353 RepID=A0A1Q3DVA3_LENED|nr:serine threonine-protein kinase [Lentinula edodes]
MGSRNSTSSSNTVTDHSDYQNREIGEWLSPFDFMETQRVILHSRAPNTGLKPLLSEAYVRWRNGDDRTLLMSGLPGAGKSMTAASVVQDLNEYYEGCKVAVVVQKAGGMFVVARLLMDALLEAPNVKEALGIILTMPTGLQGTYGKTVQHMCEGTNPEIKDLALYSLLWITFSRRVLVFSELQEAVATLLKPDNPGQCITSDILTKQSLVDACAGLITIEDRTDKVRLIHYTVHEYLVKEQVNLWTNVQRTMAVTCVSYLRYILPRLQYNSEVYVEEEIRNANIQYPFFGARIACERHPLHAQSNAHF